MSLTQSLTTSLTSSLTTPLTGFQPSDVSGLQLDLSTLNPAFYDAATFTLLDQSGNGRNAVSPNANRYPTLTQNAINGRPAFFLDGANGTSTNRDYFDVDLSFLGGNTDYTVLIVEQRTTATPLKFLLSGAPPNGEQALNLGYSLNTSVQWNQYQFGASNAYTSPVPAYSSPIARNHIFLFSSVAGKKYYQNGVEQTLTASGGADQFQGMTTVTNGQIGRYLNADSNMYVGYIGRILIWNKRLSDTELALVQQYINTEWGF
jgi:hypothetical protein